MSNGEWLGVILLISGALFPVGWRWYRRRRAAKAADRLLADVLRGKDAFRR